MSEAARQAGGTDSAKDALWRVKFALVERLNRCHVD